MVWVDILKCLLVGYNIPNPVHQGARRLKLRDPRVFDRYQILLHASAINRKTYERMDLVHRRTISPLSQPLAEEYKAIDKEIYLNMDFAENKCRKLHMGGVSFSPAYKAAT